MWRRVMADKLEECDEENDDGEESSDGKNGL